MQKLIPVKVPLLNRRPTGLPGCNGRAAGWRGSRATRAAAAKMIHSGRGRTCATSLLITLCSQMIAQGTYLRTAREPDLPRRGGQAAAGGNIMPEPVRSGQRYVPGLDGLRALAVLAVIAVHEQLGWAPGGLLGVGGFFTLRGYLITDLLLGQWSARGRLQLADFWARRARRGLPAPVVGLGGGPA